MDERLIIAGFGGQGILFSGRMWAEVMMHHGHHVTYLPSYGAEVRGGTCNCHIVVSDEEIASPVVDAATSLILMNQPSVERFEPRLRPDGLAIVNASMADPSGLGGGRTVLAAPATEMASELGDVRVANVILIGVYNAARRSVEFAELEERLGGVLGRRKADLLAINLKALHAGRDWFLGHSGA